VAGKDVPEDIRVVAVGKRCAPRQILDRECDNFLVGKSGQILAQERRSRGAVFRRLRVGATSSGETENDESNSRRQPRTRCPIEIRFHDASL
jgi:hypothetical protein